jgi:urease accessory protein
MKKHRFGQYLVGAIALTLSISSVANAHIGVGDTSSFAHGFTHPFSGLDHILAMVAVGLWATQMGGKAIWMIPSAFLVAMAGGSLLGHFGLPLAGVEQGILASDFLLGLLVLFATRLPLLASMAIVGALAIFHGYAHGAEMPTTASGLAYGASFIISTATLHLTGIAIGLGLDSVAEKLRDRLFQVGGVAILVGAVYVAAN